MDYSRKEESKSHVTSILKMSKIISQNNEDFIPEDFGKNNMSSNTNEITIESTPLKNFDLVSLNQVV